MLSNYDAEKSFAAFGFGAKYAERKRKKDAFPLSGDSDSLYLNGIQVRMDVGFQKKACSEM